MSTKPKPKPKFPQIEKGIPMPYRKQYIKKSKHDSFITFLKQLEIGDSFLIPLLNNNNKFDVQAHLAGIKLVRLRVSENEYRFWRAE